MKTTENVKPASRTSDMGSELAGLIAEHPFLRGLGAQHQEVLIDCAMLQEFSANENIFREGDLANRFYLIREGKVVLESKERDEEPILIQTLGDGDVLGWSWLFPPFYWHFDARAVEPTKAIFFYGTRLRERCDEDSALGYELMKRMTGVIIQRLQATRRQLIALSKKK